MAKQVINNAEAFSSIRGKLNSNFDELYSTTIKNVVSVSGLTLTVRAFSVGGYSFAGGSIAAIASKTQYLCVNLRTNTLHCLPRMYGHGEIYIAKIVAGASSITSLTEVDLQLPVARTSVALSKLQQKATLKTGCYGSSLVEGGGGANGWQLLLFDYAYQAQGMFLEPISNSMRRITIRMESTITKSS